MGGCASAPIESKKGDSLPPEPAKEEAAPAPAPAEVAKAEHAEKEAVEESQRTSLENLLDQDEKVAGREPKKDEAATETRAAEAEKEEEEEKAEEKKAEVAVAEDEKKEAATK